MFLSCLYVLEIKSLLVTSFANIFSHAIACLFILFIVSFAGGSNCKESACNVGDLGLMPGLGRSLGEGNRQPTPVFLAGEFHGQRNLVGYGSWGHKEADMTMRLLLSLWHDWP